MGLLQTKMTKMKKPLSMLTMPMRRRKILGEVENVREGEGGGEDKDQATLSMPTTSSARLHLFMPPWSPCRAMWRTSVEKLRPMMKKILTKSTISSRAEELEEGGEPRRLPEALPGAPPGVAGPSVPVEDGGLFGRETLSWDSLRDMVWKEGERERERERDPDQYWHAIGGDTKVVSKFGLL